jgi:hypothetical protein
VEVYNIQCSPHENYFVTPKGFRLGMDSSILVHNCGYRGGLNKKYSVFDLREGGSLSMADYVRMQQEKTSQCPGCGVGGGAWSYWWLAESFMRGDQQVGDKVFQTHVPGYEFEKTLKR